MGDFLTRLTSRKFLLAAAAIVYVLVQIAGGTMTSAQGVDVIEKIVLGYLAAEGIGDAAERYGAGIPATATPASPAIAPAVRP